MSLDTFRNAPVYLAYSPEPLILLVIHWQVNSRLAQEDDHHRLITN